MMVYEVGDKVQYKNLIFKMNAEILEIFKNPKDDYKYYIAYEDYEGEEHECLVREKDLFGFTKGTGKHLKQEILKLLELYSKEEILNITYDIIDPESPIISTCLKCGSNNISIEEEIDYDCDEIPYVSGYYLKCNCCGEINYN